MEITTEVKEYPTITGFYEIKMRNGKTIKFKKVGIIKFIGGMVFPEDGTYEHFQKFKKGGSFYALEDSKVINTSEIVEFSLVATTTVYHPVLFTSFYKRGLFGDVRKCKVELLSEVVNKAKKVEYQQ